MAAKHPCIERAKDDFMVRKFVVLVCGCSLLGMIVSQTASAGEPIKSGLQPGEKITTIFEPINVTGEHAGEPYCLICENGLSPVAMLFARDVSEPLLKLLSKLDEATGKNRDKQMGSFVVFLSNQEGLQEQLQAAAKKRGLKHIVLSIDQPAGPEGFSVSKDADVTVVLYHDHLVKANHAFRPGELTDQASDKLLADLPKILATK
jgi:hypothetical protein